MPSTSNPLPTRGLTVGTVLWATALGCQWYAPARGLPPPPSVALLDNPLRVPASDREFLWSQLVDAIDDYFQIEREERLRLVGDVLIEGRIETLPLDGATVLEPWRADSTPGFEKWHATLQSVRRRATVRAIPIDGGYLIDVAVHKELEDVRQPALDAGERPAERQELVLGRDRRRAKTAPFGSVWIPIGRDVSLEQRILANIQSRLTNR